MKILVTAPYPAHRLEELRDWFGTVIYQPWIERGRAYNAEELKELIRQTEAEALITELDELNQDVMDSWQPQPQFVAVCRATPSTIDLVRLKERNIPVFTAPARNIQAVAEWVIANIIAFYRHIHKSEVWLKTGNWTDWLYPYKAFRGQQLSGKKVGIVGLGAVGQRVAHLLEAFACEITYYDPYVPQERFPRYRVKSLEEIFADSDIVSLHLPVTAQTHRMITRELLQLMRPETLFVNAARASVVDNEALLEILQKRRILGAVVDVYDHEPPTEEEMRLIRLDNVLATPHIAGSTVEVVHNHAQRINSALNEWRISQQ